MRSFLLGLSCALFCLNSFSQNTTEGVLNPSEIRHIKGKPYDLVRQQELRNYPSWSEFVASHSTWYVHFNEFSGMPHRAYGQPLEVAGNSLEEKALLFAGQELESFGIPVESLIATPKGPSGKYSYVNFRQSFQGLRVIDSRYMVKFFNGKIVSFGCDLFPEIDLNTTPAISEADAMAISSSGLANPIVSITSQGDLAVLPVVSFGKYYFHLVYDIMVKTKSSTGIPANYRTYVDAHTGEILSRKNTVNHIHGHGGPGHNCKPGCTHDDALQVTATVTGQVYENNPYENITTSGLENIYVNVSNVNYQADAIGSLILPVTPGAAGTVRLMGPWSRVYTSGVTPTKTVTLVDGTNAITLDDVSNIKERSAYRSVQKIHDHMKLWMPEDFIGMDWQLPTNIDEDGECNAFYDGTSINFYDIGGGCNASSLVADVCYHEYGHGINDKYYQSLGGFFNNGAMGEAYADFWAISLSNSPQLGVGFNTADLEPIRRYDEDPKVYPSDISGEVHGDGEIIMGAWYDTHLLMGADWNLTIPLFVEAYAGMQAEASDGNEGEAYTDVLIDLLMADDTDGDFTNGTPHGNAIVEGFYIHGITLISNAVLDAQPVYFSDANETLPREVFVELQFPYWQYLADVKCNYRINNGSWTTVSMTANDDTYEIDIPAQPEGTVVAYYFTAYDQNGSIGSTTPIGAHLSPFPNLPFFTLVGVQEEGQHDCDDNSDFGNWQTGILADNASTGEWIEDIPVGSYTTDSAPGTMVQTDSQHTPGGEYCFITGNADSEDAPIGDNDVDDGKTTLQSPVIDMTSYVDPVITYWRKYSNNPPGGANPGQDYWQVRISNNGGTSWTYVENTKTADNTWRRNAFRVSDYVAPTAQMRFQFIASDSTHIGENLDGGSLIEAAVDDFVLYDALENGVENLSHKGNLFSIYPNPAAELINIHIRNQGPELLRLKIMSATGACVMERSIGTIAGDKTISVDIPELADGVYSVVLTSASGSSSKKLFIQK